MVTTSTAVPCRRPPQPRASGSEATTATRTAPRATNRLISSTAEGCATPSKIASTWCTSSSRRDGRGPARASQPRNSTGMPVDSSAADTACATRPWGETTHTDDRPGPRSAPPAGTPDTRGRLSSTITVRWWRLAGRQPADGAVRAPNWGDEPPRRTTVSEGRLRAELRLYLSVYRRCPTAALDQHWRSSGRGGLDRPYRCPRMRTDSVARPQGRGWIRRGATCVAARLGARTTTLGASRPSASGMDLDGSDSFGGTTYMHAFHSRGSSPQDRRGSDCGGVLPHPALHRVQPAEVPGSPRRGSRHSSRWPTAWSAASSSPAPCAPPSWAGDVTPVHAPRGQWQQAP